MKGWYFSTTDKRLRYDDGRLIEAGITHSVECKPILCKQGLHASARIIDALIYAQGPWVWQVELTGEVVGGDDKSVATHRKYIRGVDATEVLREFSRWCALEVIHLWDAPEVVKKYLATGDKSIQGAARDAAASAASAASGWPMSVDHSGWYW